MSEASTHAGISDARPAHWTEAAGEQLQPALFTLDGVEFLEPDLPYQLVAWKVRVDGHEFYVCESFPVRSDRAAIIPLLAKQARQRCQKLPPAADR